MIVYGVRAYVIGIFVNRTYRVLTYYERRKDEAKGNNGENSFLSNMKVYEYDM